MLCIPRGTDRGGEKGGEGEGGGGGGGGWGGGGGGGGKGGGGGVSVGSMAEAGKMFSDGGSKISEVEKRKSGGLGVRGGKERVGEK